MAETEVQLSEEIIGGKEAFDLVALPAVRIEDQDRRRPLRTETLECRLVRLDVEARGDEVTPDERRNLGIGIDLGIQPSTSGSHRCGAEVEEKRFAGGLRFSEDGLGIVFPLNVHGRPRCERDADRT